MLLVAPFSEHRRALGSLAASHAIVLPDPSHASANAVFAAEQASERVGRFNLAKDLPAALDQCDLSDLAYRIWKDGEKQSRVPALVAYQVFDTSGAERSRFSLIPDWSAKQPREGPLIHRPARGRRRSPRGASARRVAAMGTRRDHRRGLAVLGPAPAADRRLPAAGARRERPAARRFAAASGAGVLRERRRQTGRGARHFRPRCASACAARPVRSASVFPSGARSCGERSGPCPKASGSSRFPDPTSWAGS